jgi:hypothetical protein
VHHQRYCMVVADYNDIIMINRPVQAKIDSFQLRGFIRA